MFKLTVSLLLRNISNNTSFYTDLVDQGIFEFDFGKRDYDGIVKVLALPPTVPVCQELTKKNVKPFFVRHLIAYRVLYHIFLLVLITVHSSAKFVAVQNHLETNF